MIYGEWKKLGLLLSSYKTKPIDIKEIKMSENSKSKMGSRYRCLLATELEQGKTRRLLEEICHPLPVKVTADDDYFPQGFSDSKELILTSQRAKHFFEKHFPDPGFDHVKLMLKDKWWLTPKKGGNTPNWDIVSSCELSNGSKALIIVEAKAHKSELDSAGKTLTTVATEDSSANHRSIEKAINKANAGLNAAYSPKGFSISIKRCYQLSNRFAFAWKLASLKIPVVLMYLGFVNAKEMGDYFHDDKDWAENLLEHSNGIIPEAVWNSSPIMIGGTPIFPIYRAVDIQSIPHIVKIYPTKVVV